jgi:hypothetical protein
VLEPLGSSTIKKRVVPGCAGPRLRAGLRRARATPGRGYAPGCAAISRAAPRSAAGQLLYASMQLRDIALGLGLH